MYSRDIVSILKSDSKIQNKEKKFCLNENPLKMMKNTFNFILRARLVLKIFKFLLHLLGHVGKKTWLEIKS